MYCKKIEPVYFLSLFAGPLYSKIKLLPGSSAVGLAHTPWCWLVLILCARKNWHLTVMLYMGQIQIMEPSQRQTCMGQRVILLCHFSCSD